MISKQDARKLTADFKSKLSPDDISYKSQAILETLTETEVYKSSRQVLAYSSFNREVDTKRLIEVCIRDNKEVYLPIVQGKDMFFVRIDKTSKYIKSKFGIDEPIYDSLLDYEKTVKTDADCLMIMPGIAFDETLNRVGYGGGYYDRFLKRHEDLKKLAIAFEGQIYDELQHEDFDIRPDFIVTEDRILGL